MKLFRIHTTHNGISGVNTSDRFEWVCGTVQPLLNVLSIEMEDVNTNSFMDIPIGPQDAPVPNSLR